MEKQELDNYKKAGQIAKQVIAYAKELIKPGMLLLEIAQKIDKKIYELGGEPAFPVNLSINEIAAHYHPTLEDDTKAEGLLKVDIGVHINGFIADTAFSLDLTKDGKYGKLIGASKRAVDNAIKLLDKSPSLNDIGQEIQSTIEGEGFLPIVNLSGHSLNEYNLHAGITIPNYADGNDKKLDEGAYAIEPFATTGQGQIYEGAQSNIFAVVELKTPRSPTARKILDYVWEKYRTLPFSLREIQEKFGVMARISLKQLEQVGIVHSFPQLIEKGHGAVSQAEHTVVIREEGVEVTTL